jgi:ADP-ribose pyrophosphatase YjhB (NUDIX family)
MIDCTFEDGNEANLRHAVVDTMVFKDGKILMVKRNTKLLQGGKWGLTGGYMELNESITGAAKREVYEESGWEIKDLTLLTINDTPKSAKEDRQNVGFIFFAEAVKKTGEPDWESDEQRWYNLNNLPPLNQLAFDCNIYIELYKTYLEKNLTLPILNWI